MNVPSYLHVMDGRLRVKVPEMKGSVQKGQHVEEIIRSLEGVIRVTANPTTGNVLVFFHGPRLTHSEILITLKRFDYLRSTAAESSFQFTERVVDTISHAIARSVTEALMERAILALF